MRLISIDPGASGGIAWTDDDIVHCAPMPEGMSEQADFIRSLCLNSSPVCIIEKTGTYFPGNSGVAAATFARHCGHLEAILYMCGASTEQVSPRRWMAGMNLPKNKKERKKAIREAMARKYPHLPVTLKTADALAILTYAHKDAEVHALAQKLL